jgi:hypothetical protein
MLQVITLSMLVWTLEVVVYYSILWGFGTGLPLWAGMLALVMANFGIAVPSAPGYVGVFEAACSGAIISLGVPKEVALAYAITVHLLLYVCVTGGGLILMWRLGLGIGDLARPAHCQVEADPQEVPR